MLEKDGFDVTAADKHPDLLRRTQERNENLHVLQLDWNERDQWDEMIAEHGKNSFDVVVINGRSVRHATPQILFGYVSDILKDGGIFMWDTPDVLKKGSAQADKLENIRTFYERFGYDREYLEKNFWYMVGAPPGQNDDKNHYIESWTPSEAYAKDTAAMAGLETLETIREVNYDGANSDNLYFVMRKVEGKRRREFISESIRNMNNDMNDEL
jgi:hypothetical protein